MRGKRAAQEESWQRSTYWSEAEGRAALSAWRESGEGIEPFAARHALRATRLRFWQRRLDERSGAEPAAEAAVSLVPVSVLSAAASDAVLEVDVSGLRVRVPRGFDEDTLVRLVRALEEARTC